MRANTTSVNLLVCMSVRYITMGVVWYIYSCAYMTASEEWCMLVRMFLCVQVQVRRYYVEVLEQDHLHVSSVAREILCVCDVSVNLIQWAVCLAVLQGTTARPRLEGAPTITSNLSLTWSPAPQPEADLDKHLPTRSRGRYRSVTKSHLPSFCPAFSL